MKTFHFSTEEMASLSTAAHWLKTSGPLLLCTHIRPDGDAFGSLLGLHLLLAENGIESLPFMADAPGPKYARVLPVGRLAQTLPGQQALKALCVVDCSNPERVALPPAAVGLKSFETILNLDHHPDNRLYGHCNAVIGGATSTTEVLLAMALQAGWSISAETATTLLLGLLTDCGTFRFNNTSASTFSSAATLLEKGARYRQIVDSLHFREPVGRLKLQSELLARVHFAFDRRLAWTTLRQTDLEAFAVHRQDTENLIDIIRCIDSVEVACLVQPEDDCIRLSLRSRSPRVSAGRIARALGGGGHEAAAGARLNGVTVQEAVERLQSLAKIELDQ